MARKAQSWIQSIQIKYPDTSNFESLTTYVSPASLRGVLSNKRTSLCIFEGRRCARNVVTQPMFPCRGRGCANLKGANEKWREANTFDVLAGHFSRSGRDFSTFFPSKESGSAGGILEECLY